MERSGRTFSGHRLDLSWTPGHRATFSVYPSTDSETLPWIATAFCDIQINGYRGVDLSAVNLDSEAMLEFSQHLSSQGVATFCPTLITQPRANLERAIANLVQLIETSDLSSAIAGIHLEGPFISSTDGPRGAHPKDCCLEPDIASFLKWQDLAKGNIRLVTLAPELPGALAFIEALCSQGVRVAIGHTSASAEQIRDAVAAGASLFTHLGNGMAELIHRHHNLYWPTLVQTQLNISLIGDGEHLPDDLLQVIVGYRRSCAPDSIFLISDAIQWSGLPAGNYEAGLCQVEVLASGKIQVVGQPRLFGSPQLQKSMVERIAKRFPDWWPALWDWASIIPARWILDRQPIPIQTGCGEWDLSEHRLDFVLFEMSENGQINILELVRDGISAYRNPITV